MSAETINVNTLPTVFEVWHNIHKHHPEVVKQNVHIYSNSSHGQPKYNEFEALPIERITWSHNETAFYGDPTCLKAIGQAVEIRPKDYDPATDYSGAGRWFNEGENVKIDKDHHKSFLMVDFESPPSKELLALTIKTLANWTSDWYILDSGGSFHLVIDKLVDPKDLPIFFGQLIMDMSQQLSPTKAKLYGHIGKYLILNSDNPDKLNKWADNMLNSFGHVDEPYNGKLVFPIDMRYIAHVVKSICNDEIDDGNLRVSSKHGSVPVLIAQQTEGKVLIYECQDDPFDRKQPRLPGF